MQRNRFAEMYTWIWAGLAVVGRVVLNALHFHNFAPVGPVSLFAGARIGLVRGLLTSLGMMVATLWFDSVRLLTRAVGAWTPSSTLFFFGLVFLLVVSLNYAVRLSGMSRQLKLLAQEVALLRQRVAEQDAAPAPAVSPPSQAR